MQNLTIIGRLGRDAVIRETANGDRFLTFTVATNSYIRGAEKTTWYDVVTRSPRAMGKMKDYLTKGSSVVVVGELDASIQTGTDGVQRLRLSISADRVDFNQGGSSGNTQTDAEVVTESTKATPETPAPTPVRKKVADPVPTPEETNSNGDDESGDELPF